MKDYMSVILKNPEKNRNWTNTNSCYFIFYFYFERVKVNFHLYILQSMGTYFLA